MARHARGNFHLSIKNDTNDVIGCEAARQEVKNVKRPLYILVDY
jgi:hypothetical protein